MNNELFLVRILFRPSIVTVQIQIYIFLHHHKFEEFKISTSFLEQILLDTNYRMEWNFFFLISI